MGLRLSRGTRPPVEQSSDCSKTALRPARLDLSGALAVPGFESFPDTELTNSAPAGTGYVALPTDWAPRVGRASGATVVAVSALVMAETALTLPSTIATATSMRMDRGGGEKFIGSVSEAGLTNLRGFLPECSGGETVRPIPG